MEERYREKLVPPAEIRGRIKEIQIKMEVEDIDAALIFYRPNYFYFSGTSQYSILYIPVETDPILFVKRDPDRAREESPISSIIPFSSFNEIRALIQKNHGKVPSALGIEFDILPTRRYLSLSKTFPGVEFRDISRIIMNCRMKKTSFEIQQLKKAVQIGKEVFQAGRDILIPGLTEIEFGGLLELEAKKREHEGIIRINGLNHEGYSWHILSGPNGSILSEFDSPVGGQGLSPAFPMGAGLRKIQPNEPVLVDFNICYNGYIADQTRIFCIGELPDKFQAAYDCCRRIMNQISSRLAPGVQCSEIFDLSKRLAQEEGYQKEFLGIEGKKAKFIGHGVGLEANEIPVLAARGGHALEPSTVIAVEPKIVFGGEGVVGLENMFLINNRGCEKLSDLDEGILYNQKTNP